MGGGLFAVLGRPDAAEADLDLLGRALADHHVVVPPHVVDDRLVELVAGDLEGDVGHHAGHRHHGHVGGAAADVDDHVAARLPHRQPGADGGRHRLLDEPHLAHARVLGGLAHGLALDVGDPGGDRDDEARAHEVAAIVDLGDEVLEHRLGDGEVGDDAVAHRPNRDDVARRLAEHLLGLGAHRQDALRCRHSSRWLLPTAR